jgi:hypothetical protein
MTAYLADPILTIRQEFRTFESAKQVIAAPQAGYSAVAPKKAGRVLVGVDNQCDRG